MSLSEIISEMTGKLTSISLIAKMMFKEYGCSLLHGQWRVLCSFRINNKDLRVYIIATEAEVSSKAGAMKGEF